MVLIVGGLSYMEFFHRLTIDCILDYDSLQYNKVYSKVNKPMPKSKNRNKKTKLNQNQMSEEIEMDQVNSSDVHNKDNLMSQGDEELSENHPDNVQLNPNDSSIAAPQPSAVPQAVAAPHEPTTFQWIVANKRKVIKWTMVVLVMLFMMWLGSLFFSESLLKTRQPMFLSSFSSSSKVPEVMSPQQSDYQSFKYYQKMVSLAQKMTAQNRDATDKEMKQFEKIKFKQFFNAYKVIRTIQLGKQFSRTPKQEQQLGPLIDETELDQVINKTSFFADAVDQYQCASCYSFPIAATIEYLYKFYYNITVKLSEQQLIDCAHDDPDANGCDDGNITRGFEYVRDVGLVSTEEYPYRSITGQSFKCDTETIKKSKNVYKISGFRKLPSGNCQAIQSQLVKGNTVAAMINAGGLSEYTGGTFTDCKRFGWNHAITIVGQTEKNQWIVRNSWGKSWGNLGYFVMGHGNTCGVCTYSVVPVLKLDEKGQVLPYDPLVDDKKNTKE